MLTTHDGLRLHYEVEGDGEPVLLMHSFGFDSRLWHRLGITAALVAAGRSVVTYDARGHGRSDHPPVPTAYGADAMAADASSLLDHLGIELADLAAYSMGSYVALRVLEQDPRFRRAVLGGVGGAVLGQRSARGPLVMPDDHDAVIRRNFPYLAWRLDEGLADASALVAVQVAGTVPMDLQLGRVTADVLLLTGTADDEPGPLAQQIPHCRVRRVEADHGGTMSHPDFTPIVVDHLTRLAAVGTDPHLLGT